MFDVPKFYELKLRYPGYSYMAYQYAEEMMKKHVSLIIELSKDKIKEEVAGNLNDFVLATFKATLQFTEKPELYVKKKKEKKTK